MEEIKINGRDDHPGHIYSTTKIVEIMQTLFQTIQEKTGLNQPQIISFVVIVALAIVMVATFDIPNNH